jgi:site-specific recombinase XerD
LRRETAAAELGSVIAAFLRDAEAGDVRAAGRTYTRAELRDLRGALTHVAAALGPLDVAELRSRDVRGLVDELGAAGLRPERVSAIVDALRSVYAYAMGRGLVTTSPLVGLAPAAGDGPSPTTAIVQLGEQLARWTVRLMVMLFVLAAVGLAVALA